MSGEDTPETAGFQHAEPKTVYLGEYLRLTTKEKALSTHVYYTQPVEATTYELAEALRNAKKSGDDTVAGTILHDGKILAWGSEHPILERAESPGQPTAKLPKFFASINPEFHKTNEAKIQIFAKTPEEAINLARILQTHLPINYSYPLKLELLGKEETIVFNGDIKDFKP